MSHQFKPGDLAMIVGACSVPENIGKVCELVELLAPEQISEWIDPRDGCSVQNGDDEAGWLVIGEDILSANGEAGHVLAMPRHLMPLRGDYAPEQLKAREVEPCV
ncbi:hypothetical protein ACLUUI_05855 [Enterobacterales bacterium AW_CKDN230030176-1A_HGKHYDSX7]